MRRICRFCFLLFISAFAVAQEPVVSISRGSIPEALLRPARGEAPHYPIDTVIGPLGQGEASASAYFFANSVAAGLLSGKMEHQALSGVNSISRESYLSELKVIVPQKFRIGGGREEPDGAISFLVRFIGREKSITGELYIRYLTRQIQGEAEEAATGGSWVLEELLLEEAMDHDAEQKESQYQINLFPYERFY